MIEIYCLYYISSCERVCQLLSAGISVNSWDSEDSGNTPLHWAACYGNREIVACLIGMVTFSLLDLKDVNHLHGLECLHLVADRGADVNCVNSLGDTPLHDAVARGDIDVVEELLRAGANPFIRSIKG